MMASKPRSAAETIGKLGWYVFVAGAIPCTLFMLLFGIATMSELASAVLAFWNPNSAAEAGRDSEVESIHLALKGVEFLFLSPIPFLVLYSLSQFLQSQVHQDDQGLRAVSRVKVLISGLMIALIGTDLTSRIISNEILELSHASAACLVMLVLIAYIAVLESALHRKP